MKIFIWSHNHVFCMKHLWPNPVFIITVLFVSLMFHLSQQDDQEPKVKLDEGWVCWVGTGGHSRGRRPCKSQGKKTKKDKVLLPPLFLHPSVVPFLLVVSKTMNPPTPPNHHPFIHTPQPLFLLSFPYLSGPICFTVPCTWTNGLAIPGPNDPQLRKRSGMAMRWITSGW